MSKAIIQADATTVRRADGTAEIVFSFMPVVPSGDSGKGFKPILRHGPESWDEPVSFPDFYAARLVVEHYNEGPGDGVKRAQWNNDYSDEDGWGWNVLEVDPRRAVLLDPDRERFGSDG